VTDGTKPFTTGDRRERSERFDFRVPNSEVKDSSIPLAEPATSNPQPATSTMNATNTQNERIARMAVSAVYPMYISKVEKKGRTKAELDQVIEWLTGFGPEKLQDLLDKKATFESFFREATLNPNARLITGLICGYRVEEIEDPLTQKVRYLDKLVDELAKGRTMEKILRTR